MSEAPDFDVVLLQVLERLEAGEELGADELRREFPGDAERLLSELAAFELAGELLPRSTPGPPGVRDALIELPERAAAEGRPVEEDPVSQAPAEMIARIRGSREPSRRFRSLGEISRGGMGVVLAVEDAHCGRTVALKAVLGPPRPDRPDAEERARWQRQLEALQRRFIREARITARLQHPAIVPVHEFGVDSRDGLYFTMPRVEGLTLRQILASPRSGTWSRARILAILLRVCEAVAYAHEKGVVHRDLKPGNVMVGHRFGEVYVMDWGLAKTARDGASTAAQGEPLDLGDEALVSLTQSGVAVGTVPYMAPEQARGAAGQADPRLDVYALGAILYEVLAGHPPYREPGAPSGAAKLLERVRAGPPLPLREKSKDLPRELVYIAEKAMARERGARYPDVVRLADDLRAWLEGRVLADFDDRPWLQLRKWISRNRATAASSLVAVIVLVTAGFSTAAIEGSRRSAVERRLDEAVVLQLPVRMDELWPVHPARAFEMEHWIQDARAAVASLSDHRDRLEAFERTHATAARVPVAAPAARDEQRELDALRMLLADYETTLEEGRRALVTAATPEEALELERELDTTELELARRRERLQALELERERVRTWRFADPELEAEYARLREIVHVLEDLRRPTTGGIARMDERLRLSRRSIERSTELFAESWTRAVESIADEVECPAYCGLLLSPQVGLVPLRRNEGGLWEFWHIASGERPSALPGGGYELAADSGVVLVLVPGGESWIGAQADDPLGRNHCPPELWDERQGALKERPRRVALAPFFLSRYELTQGQWLRMAGENPSRYYAGHTTRQLGRLTRTQPVEHVSYEEASEVLWRWSLGLPTEAQWEVAARAGTEGPFWWGSELEALGGRANFADASYLWIAGTAPNPGAVDDGHPIHAPVGAFPPNPWGFQSMSGNVWELCADWFVADSASLEHAPGTGEAELRAYTSTRPIRGGGFRSEPRELRVSHRERVLPWALSDDVGVRPARPVDP